MTHTGTHTGTQAAFGSVHPSQGHGGPAASPNVSESFAHTQFFTRLPDTTSVMPIVSKYYQLSANHFILLPNLQIRPYFFPYISNINGFFDMTMM